MNAPSLAELAALEADREIQDEITRCLHRLVQDREDCGDHPIVMRQCGVALVMLGGIGEAW